MVLLTTSSTHGQPSPEPEPALPSPPDAVELAELPSRLVFSLLKAAVRVAARVGMPMARVTELLRLAYFQELRRDHPRDLAAVAERLGVSIRSAGSLNKQLKTDFFAPENDLQPIRLVTGALLDGATDPAALHLALPELDPVDIERVLALLVHNGWVQVSQGRLAIQPHNRSLVGDDLHRRIDGLNHQVELISESVWQRFVQGETDTARARSWVLAARPQDFAAFIEDTVKNTRHRAVEVEETALAHGHHTRFAVTMAFTPLHPPEDTR